MCGFFGYVTRNDSSIDKNNLDAAASAVAHRGKIVNAGTTDNLYYYHYRLPTDGVNSDINPKQKNENLILFNGVITNVDHLIKQFSLPAELSHSDTLTLAAGLNAYGEAFIKACKGMFAIAMCSGNKLTLIRDTIGIKPLYYIYNPGVSLAFASEVKALKNLDGKVQQVFQGEYLEFNLKLIKLTRKRQVQYQSNYKLGKRDLADCLRNAIVEPMQRYFDNTPNKQIACLVSGGLDSCLMAQIIINEMPEYLNRVKFYTLSQKGSSDHKYALLFAQANSIKLISVPLLPAKYFVNNHVDLVELMESKFSRVVRAGYILLALSNQIHSDGIEVVMSGEGADELFYGYDRFLDLGDEQKVREASDKFFKDVFPNTLLHRLDRVFASKLIEARVPYLDQDVVQIANNISVREMIRDYELYKISKGVLREVAYKYNVPDFIVQRPKVKMTEGVTSKKNNYFAGDQCDGYLDADVYKAFGVTFSQLISQNYDKIYNGLNIDGVRDEYNYY